MTTDALELALALHQAPIQRFALRDRPLPENIGDVLQLASAMQPQLEAAAARFSEAEDTVVEAARFYLQQVLFEPGTDAYRILGLAPDADIKRIRQHHIWLQRWLHPDRRGEDWEAALATKVNWAWQQLRNEASREQYDLARQDGLARHAVEPSDVARVQVPAWTAAPIKAPRHWMRRVVVMAVLAACVGLFYLAATRQDRVDPTVLATHSIEVDSSIRPRLPFAAESIHHVQDSGDSAAVASPVAALGDAGESPAPLGVVKDRPAGPLPVSGNPEPVPATGDDGERMRIASSTNSRIRSDDRLDAKASAANPPLPPARIVAASAETAGHADVEVSRAPVVVRQRPPAAPATAELVPPRRVVQEPLPAAAPADPPALAHAQAGVSAGRPQHSVARSKHRQPDVSNPETPDPERIDALAQGGSTPTPPPALALAVEPAGVPEADRPNHPAVQPEQGAAASKGFPPDAPDSENPGSESLVALAQGSGAETPPDESPRPPAKFDRETLMRFELARQRVRSIVDFFRNPGIAAPAWNDEPGQHTAARQRTALHARYGEHGIDRFVLDPPVWQITHSAVGLKTSYRVDAKLASAETGRFLLDMVWQDDDWKITRIEISPGP